MNRRYPAYILFGTFFLSILILIFAIVQKSQPAKIPIIQKILMIPTSTPTPTPYIFRTYTAPTIEKKQVYKIVMIGDSMTAALGPHGGGLSEYLNSLYKANGQGEQGIIIDNYAKSSNILAVNDELDQKTTISEYTFEPLLSTDFDLILVESYGYNPLSQLGVEDGIKKQNMALDTLMTTLITTHPHSAIVFVATIAPNIANYARATQPNTSAEERAKQAQERITYIKNHIEYAKNHNIPLINIYEKSLTPNGDGNMRYINMNDDIHPSFEGVLFIGHQIGDFIYNNQILPH